MKRRLLLPLLGFLLLVAGLGGFIFSPSATKADFPPNVTNFVDEDFITQISTPIAFEFLPNGKMLIISQFGNISVFNPANSNLLNVYTFPATKICTDGERGLLGLALDPNFATNNFIYLDYTFRTDGAVACKKQQANWLNNNARGRVSRFTFDPNTNTFDANSETVILDFIPTTDDSHNAGDIQFGADGLLYISVGDGSCALSNPTGLCGAQNPNAQRLDILQGKILRINKDGTIPADNPHSGTNRRCGNPALTVGTWPAPGTANCSELFSWGLRNPFRIVFKPGTDQFYINDVGESHWEEINEGIKGANYGWNTREGLCQAGADINCTSTPATMTNPIHTYKHNGAAASIVGGAFVPSGIWPAQYDNKYLYADYEKYGIFIMPATVTGTQNIFAQDIYVPINIKFGPHQSTMALYYTLYNYDAGGLVKSEIRRIRYTGTVNSPPNPSFTANPYYGSAPLTVTFNASATTDPNPGNTISYTWNFGDNSPVVTVSNPIITKTYSSNGVYTASFKATDNLGASSNTITKSIYVGFTAPVVTITSPTLATTYGVNDPITLTAVATSGGNQLPDTALSWTVLKRHANHFHPYLSPTEGNNIPITTPDPEDLPAATNSYLEIQVTATDSNLGLSTTITQILMPKKVTVGIDTVPSGASIVVNGFTFSGPFTVTSWPKYILNLEANNQTLISDTLTFLRWSDNGTALHSVTTPDNGAVYTATFAVNGCDLQGTTVVKSVDDGSCGTLRYVVGQAPANSTVVLSTTNPISLTTPLTVTNPITIQGQGNCASGGLTVINGSLISNLTDKFFRIAGGVTLKNLQILGLQVKATSGGNNLSCVRVYRQ